MALPALLYLALVTLPAAPPRVHSPAVETRLGYLVGDWTILGLPAKTYRQKCVWYGGRAFVVCSVQDQRVGVVSEIVFGYSELERRFTYQSFDSAGRAITQLGFPSGTYGIVFTDDRLEPAGSARVQTTINLEDEGLHYTQYMSIDGGSWRRTADYLHVPAVQRRPKSKRSRR